MNTCCEVGDRIINVECEYENGKFTFLLLPACLPERFTVRFKAPADFKSGDMVVVKDVVMPVKTLAMTNCDTGQFAAGVMVLVEVDWIRKLCFIAGSNATMTRLPIKALLQDTDFYVGLNGNDSTGDGTLDTPWATIEGALDHLKTYIGCGFLATIKVLDGTYEMDERIYIWDGCLPGGRIRLTSASEDPTKVILNWDNAATVSGANIIMVHNTVAIIDNLTLRVANAGNLQSIVAAFSNAYLSTNSLHVEVAGNAIYSVFIANSNSRLDINGGGRNCIEVKTEHELQMGAFVWAVYSSLLYVAVSEVKWSGTVHLTQGFAVAECTSNIRFDGQTTTFSGGTITGPRYNINRNAICTTGQNENYLPGNQSGSVSRGGIYY